MRFLNVFIVFPNRHLGFPQSGRDTCCQNHAFSELGYVFAEVLIGFFPVPSSSVWVFPSRPEGENRHQTQRNP